MSITPCRACGVSGDKGPSSAAARPAFEPQIAVKMRNNEILFMAFLALPFSSWVGTQPQENVSLWRMNKVFLNLIARGCRAERQRWLWTDPVSSLVRPQTRLGFMHRKPGR